MTLTQTDLLAAYAAGETSPGMSLLCATQVATNDEARAFVAMAEAVAGAALRDDPESAPVNGAAPAMCASAMLARLDEPAPAPVSAPAHCAIDDPLPRALRAAAGPLDEISWGFRLPGVSEYALEGFAPEKVSLMRVRSGTRIPEHTHRGLEATLILGGAMQDGDRLLQRGDLALSGEEHHHHPRAIGEETCYCLVVVDGGLRFTGMFTQALNIFSDR